MIKLNNNKFILKLVLSSLVIASLVGCNGDNKAVELLGAGASFPYPLYSKMFDEYHKEKGVRINYQAIGSGGGIRQLKNKTVDFGASDAFMNDKKLKTMGKDILHIPICLGAVSLAYNVPGVSNLKLDAATLSGIFLGSITNWNDEKIQKINPNVQLPNTKIVSVHRSDGSGTTFIFSDYLAKVSNAWKSKVGRGKSLNWPNGLGGKGNAGVAGIVKQTPGSIGYVSHIYAVQNKMPVVSLQNKSGRFISPSLASVSKAANTTIPADTRASITNSAAKDGYPISGFTWVLVYKDQNFNSRTMEQAIETKKLLQWMVSEGQRFAEPLLYAPLTNSVVQKANALIDTLHFSGKPL